MLTDISRRRRHDLHAARAAAGHKGAASRWGKRGSSKTVRVDADAADLLARVPDRDRRAVASKGVREAASAYLAKNGDDYPSASTAAEAARIVSSSMASNE